MVLLQESADEDYHGLAAAIADERRDRIARSVEDVQPTDAVIYVDPPSELSESTLYDLYSMNASGAIDGVGVITGRTATEAQRLFDRTSTGRGDHGILVRGRNRSVTCDDDDVSVLAGDEVTVDNVESLCSDGLASLSMRIKARDIHAFVDDGLLCGVPSSLDEFALDGLQPSCVAGGETECIYDGNVLHADRLDAHHVFVSGCSSPLANNHAGLPVNLGLALLSNAVSLVAPVRPVSVHQYHAALNYALVRAGYTAAERVYVLNRAAAAAGMGLCQYVLFGRPDSAVAPATEGSYDAEVTADDDGYHVSLADVDAHVVDVSMPAERFTNDQHRFFLRATATGQVDGPMYYVAFREGDDVRVVVCSWGRIETDALAFDLRPSRVLEESRHVPTLHEAAARVDVGLIGGKAKRQFTDARNRLAGAARHHREEAFDAGAAESTLGRLEEVQSSLHRARESLAEAIVDRPGGLLQAQYSDTMYTKDLALVDNGCPYCHRDLHVQTATDTFQRVERSLGVCPLHIYVFDAPSGHGEPRFPTLDWDLSPLRYGDVGEFVVSFTNPRAAATGATIALRSMSPGDEERIFSPAKRTVELGGHETISEPFELDSTALDPDYTTGSRWFEATVVTDDLQVYTGMRTLFLQQ